MYTPFPEQVNRRLAWILIIAGILMAPDITVPTPFMDVLINVPLSIMLALVFGISFPQAMFATFMLAYALIAAGVLIYPYNTKRLISGKFHTGIALIMARPHYAIISIAILIIIVIYGNAWFQTYEDTLRDYIMTAFGGAAE